MKRINILYYEPTSGYGGSSRCLFEWLKILDKEKYKPIVAVHHNGPTMRRIKELRVKTIDISYKEILFRHTVLVLSYVILILNFLIFYIPTVVYIYMIAKKNNVKILHLNVKVIGAIPGIIVSKLLGIPCICHLHDIKVPVNREKFFSRWVDCFVVLTEKAQKLYKKEYPDKRIELIYNGIDLKNYDIHVDTDRLKQEFGIEKSDKIVGIVGRLVEGKGFLDFIKAAKIVRSKISNVKFMIVGNAPGQNKEYENDLKDLVKELDLGKSVIFTGWREDVKQIMSTFDVLVQASSTFPEGFGLTVVEAMALSKPLVVTNIPGPSEIVIESVTGYIVPPVNPEKLAEAIEKIISDEELAKKMGENGRKRVEKCFNLDITIRKIESLYQSLLNGRNING